MGRTRRYPKGTILIHEGDVGDTLFIVLSGRLRAYSEGTRGHEITYGEFGPGEYVGEMSLDGGERSASVITLDACTCSVVSRQVLMDYIAQNPAFALELLGKVIRRARATTQSARLIALNDVYGRLVGLLQRLAGPPGEQGERVVASRLTHQELANRLGCSREMISRLMKDLERGGYLGREGRTLVLRRALPERW
jgi:CRP/FNR family cyclic AMP-dependent transcriptional regulator